MLKSIGMAMIVFMVAGFALAAETAVPVAQPAKELKLDLGNGVSLKLVQIPAGQFLMGSPETEKDRGKDEVQHEVTISKPFYMGVTHVTVDQFAAFVKDSAYKTDAEKVGGSLGFDIKDGKLDPRVVEGCSWRNPSFDQKGDHPVVQVSWNDATAFCDWLSKKSGKTVVLPTEAQWEYACRAGTKTAYPWGDNPADGKGWANCADQSLKKKLSNAPAEWELFSWDDGFAFTAPVGSFKGNAFGLYDMNGNACQWCRNRDGDYEKGAATNPTAARNAGLHVVRGGSWYTSPPAYCRSAFRWLFPIQFDYVGFRVAVVGAGVD
ncbi:MAG: formylglycine-generating enzyme family protein [Planctomycetota bacterium]|nr:formylglycine-generating enzyme family protein [Planctomycetota bacterium]